MTRNRILEKIEWRGDHLILPGQEATLTRVYQFDWVLTQSAVLPWFAKRFDVLQFTIGNRTYAMPPPTNKRVEAGISGDLWNLLWDGLPEQIEVKRGQMIHLKVMNTSDKPSGFVMVFGGHL